LRDLFLFAYQIAIKASSNSSAKPARPKLFESDDCVGSTGAPDAFGALGFAVGSGVFDSVGSGVASGEAAIVGIAELAALVVGLAVAFGVADAFVDIGVTTAPLFPELSGFNAGLLARQIA
jgi:hypothetical protein